MTRKSPIILFLTALAVMQANAQDLTQTIRGSIVDKISHAPLPGATIVVENTSPILGATADGDGNFRITKVPVGNHTLRITYLGYLELTLPNVIVNSGKEVVLQIPLEESIVQMQAVVIEENIDKTKALNDLANVSARTFSVEETRKYAAAVNDPARTVISYAGVIATSDGNNAISIRGNSPYGLIWRMEGVDIPNPNHFANVATSGGGISILSTQLLTNSDFLTGAFPAEYGNALSGVFDVNLRKGNNEKAEYTFQAGVLGIDLAAEGPLAKDYRGSYLVNYRYSTLSVLTNMGIEIGDAVTNFQDLCFNFHFPTRRAGTFSMFGFGGLSDQKLDAKKDSLTWESSDDRYNSTYFSNTGAIGLKHSLNLSSNAYLQSAVVLSANDHGYQQEKLNDEYTPIQDYKENHFNGKLTISTVLNNKLDARHSLRSGLYVNRYYYNLKETELNDEQVLVQRLNARGRANTLQLFTQWNFRMTEALTFNTGLHYLQLFDNGTASLEPRASLRYSFNDRESLSLGYGLHSQMQPLGIYEAQVQQDDGTIIKPNSNLGFNKAHHVVLAYDRAFSEHLRIKAETYFQHQYNIPVSADPASPLSVTNNEDGYITDPLVNKGLGRNYGLELTLEQFMHHELYFLLSASAYDARYRALDNRWRNSRYNGNFALAFTAGKEFKPSGKKNRVYGINVRALSSGGFRNTPIDIERSMQEGETHYFEAQAFTEQLPAYFRTDIRLSMKRNRPKSTTTLALDLQNATNHENLGGEYFDPETGEVKRWYQLPLLPVLSYKIEF